MKYFDVYLSLGGNIGDSNKVLKNTLLEISNSSHLTLVNSSSFYKTTPVSHIKQPDFINCTCHIKTSLSPYKLHEILHKIEVKMGKKPKCKNSPRVIDIDIIFFGNKKIISKELTVPHKEWKNRLFVLKPLSDILKTISIVDDKKNKITINIEEIIGNFTNTNNEIVTIMN